MKNYMLMFVTTTKIRPRCYGKKLLLSFYLYYCITSAAAVVSSFVWRRTSATNYRSMLLQNNNNNDYNDNENSLLQERIHGLQLQITEHSLSMPPNPKLSAKEFVLKLLQSLKYPNDPVPDFGFKVLLRSSTERWRSILRRSIGAPDGAVDEVILANALGSALSRPNNQFAILCSYNETSYTPVFPTDIVDYQDGTCWVECQLRGGGNHNNDNHLLAITGWTLKRSQEDGLSWLVDFIDWQDFRDSYRPGIGREEWERICG